jgi:hypothetical protein
MVEVVNHLPERRQRGRDWPAIMAQVDAAGGEWCAIGEFHFTTGSKLRAGKFKYVDPNKYEIVGRRGDVKKYDYTVIYMRLRDGSHG